MGIGDIVPRISVLKEVPSGDIRLESGSDGLYLMFNCACEDALQYCKAQCCGMRGTVVSEEEIPFRHGLVELDEKLEAYVMKRDSDGFCSCLDRNTRTCTIYEDRPQTCQEFHCTLGSSQRGWKLHKGVTRQDILDD